MEIEHLNLLGGFKKLPYSYFYLFIALVFKWALFKMVEHFTFYFCPGHIFFFLSFSHLCIPPIFSAICKHWSHLLKFNFLLS